MSPERPEARLAVVFFSDLCGYSRHMGQDETAALRRLDAHNKLVLESVGRHQGRVVKTVGDAFMVEFGSTAAAAECGLEILAALRRRNREIPEDPIEVRIGIHAGDVVERDGDLFGHTVNLGARLQQAAAPGTLCVAESVLQQIRPKVRAEVEPIGKPALKNIAEPLKLFLLRPTEEGLRGAGDSRTRRAVLLSAVARLKKPRPLALAAGLAALLAALGLRLRLPGAPAEESVHPAPRAGAPLRLGAIAYLSPQAMQEETRLIAEALGRALKRPLSAAVVADYAEAGKKLEEAGLDLLLLPPVSYIRLKERLPGTVLLGRTVYEGVEAYQGVVVVRMQSPFSSLASLKGAVMCWVSASSTSGYLFPRALLRARGLDPDRLFRSSVMAGDHLSALRALRDGACDAAAVYAEALHSGREAGLSPTQYRIIAETAPIPSKVLAASPSLPSGLAREIKRALRSVEFEGPAAARAGAHPFSKLSGFKPAEDRDYDGVRAMLRAEPSFAADGAGG